MNYDPLPDHGRGAAREVPVEYLSRPDIESRCVPAVYGVDVRQIVLGPKKYVRITIP